MDSRSDTLEVPSTKPCSLKLAYASSYKLSIVSLCRSHYLRNNKRGGLKNLRCFPECLPAGHHPKGFCGHTLSAECETTRPLPTGALMVGLFITVSDTISDVDKRSFELGREIHLSTLMRDVRKCTLNIHTRFCQTKHF